MKLAKRKKEKINKPDRVLLVLVLVTVLFGFLLFLSAALGLHAKEGGASFSSVVTTQIAGVVLGLIFMTVASYTPYTIFRKYAVFFFLISVVLMILVLIPQIGLLHGGARRWIILGPISFQPADLFKIASVIFYASWLAKHRKRITQFKYSVVPLAIMLGIAGLLLFLQPKIGSFIVIACALISMIVVSGAKLQHILLLAVIAAPLIYIPATQLPYVRNRLDSYLNPDKDPRGSGYQRQQALIAVGSGGLLGRGYGQSVQKFSFLPEPIGDSIFAVTAEELGFIGGTILIILILLITYRSLVIAVRAPDLFARLLVVGIIISITAQSFINIAAMVGIIPITGMPLVFVSHGGTAMVTALVSMGIVLNISRYSKL